MKTKSILCLISALFTITVSAKPAQKVEPTVVVEHYQTALDELVPGLLDKFKVPAAGVGIIKSGEIVFHQVYGEHQLGSKAPKNTIFNVASITKSVVAVTVMKLVEEGKWDLDEPLSNYHIDPDLADDPRTNTLTTRHCLTHTTGFKNWRWHESDKKLKFNFNPGERYQYSGEGMEYVRKAIEKKFNKDFSVIVNDVVFAPLEMKDATLNWIDEKDESRFAQWHDTQGNLHDVNHETPKTNAADDLLITVHDMLKFNLGILDHKVIDRETYNLMATPQVKINSNIEQSLGWVHLDNKEKGIHLLNHDGGDTGVVATNIIFPRSKDGIAIFTNGNNGASVTNAILKEVLVNGLDVVKTLRWENKMPDVVELTSEQLNRFVGTYRTDRGFDIAFINEDNQLVTVSEVYPRQALLANSTSEFMPLPFEVYFQFEETDEGMSMKLLNPDREVELKGKLVKLSE